jgi:hypothetical protein
LSDDDNDDDEPSSSSSDASPREHAYDIKPTWPKKIDVTKVPALVSWQSYRLPDLLLDIHWALPTNKALFKLRASVMLKDGGPNPHRRGKTTIFVFIYPERIRQLSVDMDPTDKMLGHDTRALSFALSRPSVLVLPNTPCEPRNRMSADVLDSLRVLASVTSFTVHVNLPHWKLSPAQILELGIRASGQEMSTIAGLANTTSLGEGRGVQLVEGDTLAQPAAIAAGSNSGNTVALPPEYGEAGPNAPPAFTGESLPRIRSFSHTCIKLTQLPDKCKKRRRRRSSSGSASNGCVEPMDRSTILSLLDSRLSSLKQHFDDGLAAHRKEVVELIGEAEVRILSAVQGELRDHYCEVEDSLERRIRTEMAEVEDAVMRNISEAPLQATLTFSEHPWY